MNKLEIERACMRTLSSTIDGRQREEALYELHLALAGKGAVHVLAQTAQFKLFNQEMSKMWRIQAGTDPNFVNPRYGLTHFTLNNLRGQHGVTVIILGFPWQHMNHTHIFETHEALLMGRDLDVWNIQDW
jgi:hypothetical protein